MAREELDGFETRRAAGEAFRLEAPTPGTDQTNPGQCGATERADVRPVNRGRSKPPRALGAAQEPNLSLAAREAITQRCKSSAESTTTANRSLMAANDATCIARADIGSPAGPGSGRVAVALATMVGA